ncbi:hypothetical protein RI129_000498 [Pyrocoelia pectoralis]|uniref:Dehydrogenase/reductase SDR family member 11 n=1 Tax=Pyrocoelia pectoralis TaxID=417401 RepID=A0AAN7VTG1_9COLE
MDRWQGKVAVVTGASSGIGQAITKSLVEKGLLVVGMARRKEKVDELSGDLKNAPGKLYSVRVDVTNEAEIVQAFKWIKENVGSVHILVNNAGILRMTNLIEGKTELWREMIDTNVLSLCIATREVVKEMRLNNIDGHIIHINSMSGHKVVYHPLMNLYPATKYAVTALTETLRQELNSLGSKIKISSISPGYVDTNIGEAAAIGSGYPGRIAEMQNVIKCSAALQPSDVANAVIYVLSTPKHVQVHELKLKPMQELF